MRLFSYLPFPKFNHPKAINRAVPCEDDFLILRPNTKTQCVLLMFQVAKVSYDTLLLVIQRKETAKYRNTEKQATFPVHHPCLGFFFFLFPFSEFLLAVSLCRLATCLCFPPPSALTLSTRPAAESRWLMK